MKNKPILLTIALSIIAIFSAYVTTFYPIFGLQLSGDTAVWGQFGDYVGGTLNPILSFISIILLIRSVSLQNDANNDLRKELEGSEKTEKFRLFNSLFFSIIESQRILMRELVIVFYDDSSFIKESGAAAVIRIENVVEKLRLNGASNAEVAEYINNLDEHDQIFGILRAFYIAIKIICEKLDDSHGFDERERKEQISTLINLTDFAQLRLILMGRQFLAYPSMEYLRGNQLFLEVAKDLKLKLDPY